MKFRSTRGGVCGGTFEEALLSGYAADGGLSLPEDPPVLSREEWKQLAMLSYPQLVKKMLRLFISQEELSDSELDGEQTQFWGAASAWLAVSHGRGFFANLYHRKFIRNYHESFFLHHN